MTKTRLAAPLLVACTFSNIASAQLLYSFEDDPEEWIVTQLNGDFEDNDAIVETFTGVGNTDGNNSLQIIGRTGGYVRTSQVTLDPDRVDLMNEAVLDGGKNIEFDWTIVASENPDATRYWIQLAINNSAGWTQIDMFADNGWPEWDPAGPEVQTITASVPLESFGSGDPGFNGAILDGFATTYQFLIAMGGDNESSDERIYYLDNFRLVDPLETPVAGGLMAGDADQDFDFDQLDLVQVQIASKYLSGQAATWGEGDWDGAPGGSPGNPPAGNGMFDQLDIIAALNSAVYLTGPYNAVSPNGVSGDGQTSVIYDPSTGEVGVDAPAGVELTSINIDSAGGIFTGEAAANLGGSFDNDADGNIFKATFGGSFGSLSFGNIARTGLAQDFVLNDLTVVGSLSGGGSLGDVDLIYVPESSSVLILVMGWLSMLHVARRRRES